MAFPYDYIKYQAVIIDKDKVSGSIALTNFPVLIDLSDLENATTDIFDTCRSDGGDIRVTLSDGTTQLAREIIEINTTAKTGKIRVCIPSLAYDADTVILVWYNGIDTEPAADSTYGSQAVWDSDFLGVWHLNSDGHDSTGNGYNGTLNGTYAFSPGRICGNAIDCNHGWMTTNCPKGSIGTIEMLLNFDAFGTYRQLYGVTSGGNDFEGWANSVGALILRNKYTTKTFAISTWYHFAYRYDQVADASYGNGSVLVDGEDCTGAVYQSGQFGSGNIFFGADTAAGAYSFVGLIESIRYSAVMRSADWLKTMYNNESSPSTFYSVSAEQSTQSTINCNTGSVVIHGINASVSKSKAIMATTCNAVINSIPASVIFGITIQCSTATVNIQSFQSAISKTFLLIANTGIITASSVQALISLGINIETETASIIVHSESVDIRSGHLPVVPAKRTLNVPSENRTFNVVAENRILTVVAENRILTII